MRKRQVVLKRNESASRNPTSTTSSLSTRSTVRYAECQKNHAASIGGYAVDGCREFIASSGEEGALTCAACSCHRNFHRRDVEPEIATGESSSPSSNTGNSVRANIG